MGCQDFVSDFLTWIDDSNNEVVLLSGIESYEQLAPDRWRWKIRPGVKFHNGAPFNAAAAKFGIDYNAVPANVSAAVTWLGPDIKGEVVDDLTFDLVCPQACPIAPRAGIFTDFQDPEWFQNADEGERSSMTIGFGPYRIIDYQPGVHTRFEAYEDYLPNEAFAAQAPSIQFITHTYRAEATVRASMVAAGEADWVADIGFEQEGQVPQAKSGKTAEVYTLVLDTIWHPELKKQKVRLALAHAINCPGLLQSLFGDRVKCHGAISMKGTVGITEENSRPREYNPELARQLLAEAATTRPMRLTLTPGPAPTSAGWR
jgi:peptide/nickel transport system substrate-binding protein